VKEDNPCKLESHSYLSLSLNGSLLKLGAELIDEEALPLSSESLICRCSTKKTKRMKI
jgi:hypothetical protein